jgi:poly(A) polymerase
MKKHLQHPVFKIIAEQAESMNAEAFVVGGYVRDILSET